MTNNKMETKFLAISSNESFARVVISAFCIQMSPTIEELEDIKTAVSEAVTNSIVHGYSDNAGYITMKAKINDDKISISISDDGVGIKDIERARQPFFTTMPEKERSGMGITVMESFMDNVAISNKPSGGVVVTMEKVIKESARSVI